MSEHGDLFAALENVQWLVTDGGEITLGSIGVIDCAAVACDEVQCLAMLVKDPEETLSDLLHRLDAAIAYALEHGETVDEINPPTQ